MIRGRGAIEGPAPERGAIYRIFGNFFRARRMRCPVYSLVGPLDVGKVLFYNEILRECG